MGNGYIIIIILFLLFSPQFIHAQDTVEADSFSFDESEVSNDVVETCKQSRGTAKPRIKIDFAKPMGAYNSSLYLVKGIIVGSCIDEAGYYEDGKIKEKFKITLSDSLNKFPFNVTSYEGSKGEIRVYSLDGRFDKLVIEDEVERYRIFGSN